MLSVYSSDVLYSHRVQLHNFAVLTSHIHRLLHGGYPDCLFCDVDTAAPFI